MKACRCWWWSHGWSSICTTAAPPAATRDVYKRQVAVKAISREAGARTKMAVWSKDPNVYPVSACIGEHGDRVAAVVEKLGGEKIDVVKWSEDISEFISAALSPAKAVSYTHLDALTKSFIRDSHASQTGKGTDDGLMRLKTHMVEDVYKRQAPHWSTPSRWRWIWWVRCFLW